MGPPSIAEQRNGRAFALVFKVRATWKARSRSLYSRQTGSRCFPRYCFGLNPQEVKEITSPLPIVMCPVPPLLILNRDTAFLTGLKAAVSPPSPTDPPRPA